MGRKELRKIRRTFERRNNADIIDWTTSINNSEMRFIKGMCQDVFPEIKTMNEEELCQWCKDRDIYYDIHLYQYIAEYNSKNDTGYFTWLQ